MVEKLVAGDVVTKKIMLSAVAQVFDPMGYLAPALLLPKLIIQETWSKKFGWDEDVPKDVAKRFKKWLNQLASLQEIRLPRYCQVPNPDIVEVNVCCDSSSDGTAAVAFLKTADVGGAKLQFLMCKSRLAPLKKITIPRLELISCVIAVRMARLISEALEMPLEKFVFWSDSATALAWIQRVGDWGVFVGNRVKEILSSTKPEQWHHVPGKQNPADLPSRGCLPIKLLESKWWEGPSWMLQNPVCFLNSKPDVNELEVVAEMRKTAIVMMQTTAELPRFSSYRKNVAVWGWALRFVLKCRRESSVSKPFLLISELRQAEKIVISQIQRDSFEDYCQQIGGIQVGQDKDGS